MSAIGGAVETKDLWKRYHGRLLHGRSIKTAFVNRVLRRTPDAEIVWALQDVSFAVRPGEAVAVIGPNGSGKTTLLGLLSRVLRPTRGEVVVRGRVCVLLEAAVAFHPDLTGIENVLLQGMILGMTGREARARLGDIVAFAEAEPYIEEPVRTYSLGQRARLGFAVAAHLSPEVLLIDEVLAVVDEEFHLACYDRIRQLREQGCAVLFVSHVLDQVREVCDRGIWLEAGRVRLDGPVAEVIRGYEGEAAGHHRA